MNLKQKDVKLLWGRSGNRCAICKCELSEDSISTSSSFPIGEQAHIVAEDMGGPRGNSKLTIEERNSYHNLVLLCPTDHSKIDKNIEDYSIEKLHYIKSLHELWVRETLSETEDLLKSSKKIVLAAIIDSAVTNCLLETWQDWTSMALSPEIAWPEKLPDQIMVFRNKVIGSVWPDGYPEFKKASITLSVILHNAAQEFLKHADLKGNLLRQIKFYRGHGFNPNYDRDAKEFDKWQNECYKLIHSSTRAANWFADVVRRDVNPLFFAERGKFLITDGPFEDLIYKTSLLEFSDEQKIELPDSLFKA